MLHILARRTGTVMAVVLVAITFVVAWHLAG